MQLQDLIKRLIVTEKSSAAEKAGKYIFSVEPKATKSEIKKALKSIYKVDTVSIRTLNEQPLRRRYRGKLTLKKGGKKAIVTLKAGQKIEI